VTRVSDVPAVVEAYRKGHKGVPLEELVSAYFDSLEKLQASKKDAAARLRYAMMCLSFLEPLIRYSKKEGGKVPPVIPAIPEATIFHAINGARGQLQNILDLVKFFPEVHDYIPTVEEGFVILELASKIRKLLQEKPGAIQNKLKRTLEFDDGRLISRVVHYMEISGQLKRKKSGNTYELYLQPAGEAPSQDTTESSEGDHPCRETQYGPERRGKKRRWWQRGP